MMKLPRNPALVLASAALVFSAQAVADHNSKWGEGWANMPNDIHNTRLDTRATDDNEAFRDFVQYGDGADSVNRFDDGEEGGNRQMKQAGPPAEAAADQDRQRDRDHDQAQDQQKDQAQDRLREHQDSATAAGDMTRTRQSLETRQSTRLRQSIGAGGGSRSQSGARQGGGRGGR